MTGGDRLGWAGLGWAQLGCAELHWAKLGWAGPENRPEFLERGLALLNEGSRTRLDTERGLEDTSQNENETERGTRTEREYQFQNESVQ